MKQLLFLSALCLIVGCSKKGVSFNEIKQLKNNKKSLVSPEEAKLFDLPVPFDAVLIKDLNSDNSCAYRSKISVDQLVSYIEKEMDLLGWKLVIKFFEKEASLVFEKPLKYSIVSIRPNGNANLIFIFNSNK